MGTARAMAEAVADTAATGSCHCGGVRYHVTGPMRDVIACHCTQCQKTSGSFVMATQCARDDLVIDSDETLTWYRASDTARRGFCGRCGGHLFWEADHSDRISLFAGCLDQPSGLKLSKHIYCADKGDYYEIADGLPQA